MRAWLYYRLSRDEDEEMNSLQNQRQILVDYAEQNGYEIVGESFDDNVSGMTFNRKGLGKLEIAVDEGKIDVVLVKDLSRLGRHRTQTELFIDHLRQNNVKVISVTEGIDSFNENDDLLIGFKQIFNDFYAKDISKKVKAGVRQKQKGKGLIESLPLGYKRGRNTNTVLVDDETAWIVQEVFKLYVDGYGTLHVKKNAYVFDFDPARTLIIFEEFANDLSSGTSGGKGDSDQRKQNVRELLNFFPVIGEDENGEMIELDAEKVLSIPRKIRSLEVVRRGFMSNFLFQNIANIFNAPPEVIDIISSLPNAPEGDLVDVSPETREDLSVNDEGEVELSDELTLSTAVLRKGVPSP